MSRNRLKETLQGGDSAFGVLLPWASPDIIEILAKAGFDWLLIDAEHGSIGGETCKLLTQACSQHGLTSIVRIPENSTDVVRTYLRAGAQGVFVPHVNSAEDARNAVAAARSMPNDDAVVIVQVEEITAVHNLDEILGVEGVFGVCVGPGDLAITMGHPGNTGHPEVKQVVRETEARIREVGVPLFPFVTEADGVAARAAAAGSATAVCVRFGSLLMSATLQFMSAATDERRSRKSAYYYASSW